MKLFSYRSLSQIGYINNIFAAAASIYVCMYKKERVSQSVSHQLLTTGSSSWEIPWGKNSVLSP